MPNQRAPVSNTGRPNARTQWAQFRNRIPTMADLSRR